MDAVTLRQYETLSPFEIKNDLARLAAKTANASQVAYLNAGRGNPNWIATEPRSAFFLLRPDGHIGLCGGVVDAAAVRRYFAENLALLDGERHRPIAGGNRPTAPVASVVTGGAC